ncbi:Carnosine N-methyltransferase [Pleurotus pulmonarius]
MDSIWFLSPDMIVLALFFVFSIAFLAHSGSFSSFTRALIQGNLTRHDGPFSLRKAVSSYENYRKLSMNESSRMRASSSSILRSQRRLVHQLGYSQKLDALDASIRANAVITDEIARLAHKDHPAFFAQRGHAMAGDVGRVREALKHFVRDWSEEGKEERETMFSHILEVLRRVPEGARREQKVLVPGAGLGRLAWEISQLGFDTTANELSYYMILALRFLLSPSATNRVNQHTLQPYSHWFSHQRSNSALFRRIAFPDALPRVSPSFHLLEEDFLLLDPAARTYDCIVTLFFIDTSLNVISTIEHIHALLRAGGTWINLGPLLWTAGAQARVELSLEEVVRVAESVGFTLEEMGGGERTREVRCEYTADRQAMMEWVYKAQFWVARKGA